MAEISGLSAAQRNQLARLLRHLLASLTSDERVPAWHQSRARIDQLQ